MNGDFKVQADADASTENVFKYEFQITLIKAHKNNHRFSNGKKERT